MKWKWIFFSFPILEKKKIKDQADYSVLIKENVEFQFQGVLNFFEIIEKKINDAKKDFGKRNPNIPFWEDKNVLIFFSFNSHEESDYPTNGFGLRMSFKLHEEREMMDQGAWSTCLGKTHLESFALSTVQNDLEGLGDGS